MWSFEDTQQATATPEAVFDLWADVAGWSRWDTGIEQSRLDGPFTTGSAGSLRPNGQGPVGFVLTSVVPGRSFSDETSLPGAAIRFIHTVEEAGPGRVSITHRVEIEGPATDQIGATVGAGIREETPHAVAALARLAEGER
jgi:hypothetical protein